VRGNYYGRALAIANERTDFLGKKKGRGMYGVRRISLGLGPVSEKLPRVSPVK